mgnify:CR=1 FL=1
MDAANIDGVSVTQSGQDPFGHHCPGTDTAVDKHGFIFIQVLMRQHRQYRQWNIFSVRQGAIIEFISGANIQ